MCLGMILPKVILKSQDILVSSSEGPQDGFFSFSSGGYLVGGNLRSSGRASPVYCGVLRGC